ncbi:predicted protein [Histoplasma capsulatum var. duboisii H88]|uniref:Predicted protein n=1 Tax=Ajellomyces capsulatus (strain H88) TaxID=544711 RepID=F0U903_AJEC8|nr:predicted protein [Histoplasma capsulatum var. duboisii H88]
MPVSHHVLDFFCPLNERLEPLHSQHIESTLGDCPVVNEVLQDLAAELLTVDNKIKGAVLRRRTAVHVKRFVIESAVGVKLRITAVDGANHFTMEPPTGFYEFATNTLVAM